MFSASSAPYVFSVDRVRSINTRWYLTDTVFVIRLRRMKIFGKPSENDDATGISGRFQKPHHFT
jgi:hypothetical protein